MTRNPYRARGRMKGYSIASNKRRIARGGTNAGWLWVLGFITLPLGIGILIIVMAIIIEWE